MRIRFFAPLNAFHHNGKPESGVLILAPNKDHPKVREKTLPERLDLGRNRLEKIMETF
jgi:hypothetical protein